MGDLSAEIHHCSTKFTCVWGSEVHHLPPALRKHLHVMMPLSHWQMTIMVVVLIKGVLYVEHCGNSLCIIVLIFLATVGCEV